MPRKPRRNPAHHKPPTVNQRLRAQAKRADAAGNKNSNAQRHNLDFRIDKAQALWNEGRYDEAIWYYERALARDPKNPVLLVDVARSYALRYRFADAEKLIELAQSLYPDDARLQQMLGRSFVQIHQFDRAITCFRRALDLNSAPRERPPILLELAKMYERLHDLEAARDCATKALELAPNFEKARFALATIERRAGNVEQAESLWRYITEEGQAAPGVVAESWYELAALHDKTGRFDDAYGALVKAKQIFSRAAGPHLEHADIIARGSGKTYALITADHCERWNAAAQESTQLGGGLALLTSHPRSGTTLLEQVLDTHPGATSADELQVLPEIVYAPLGRYAATYGSMIEALERCTLEELEQLRLAYWNAMEGALRQPIGNRILLDKNPAMTGLLPVIARVFPDMKILFALRDPRDVVMSCFMQRLPLNAVSVHYLTLEDTVKNYVRTMRNWLKIREMLRNPWLEVRYEDTVADVEQQARRVLSFLQLPWDETVLQYHHRAKEKHVHSPTYEAVTKPVYTTSIGRWRNYEAQLAPYIHQLQPYIEAFGYE